VTSVCSELRSYMNKGVVEKIRAAGGEVYAITSEPQHLADQAHAHWKLDFENVGDPHQEISRTCSERGWLTLYANKGDLEFLQRGANWEVEHPKGYFQPGVLALTNAGRVLYRWRSVPSAENLNGTLARPTPQHAWGAIERSLAAGDPAGRVREGPHSKEPAVRDQCGEEEGSRRRRLIDYGVVVVRGISGGLAGCE